MHLDIEVVPVNKLVKLGKREAGKAKTIPIQFTVSAFDHKRQIWIANSLLRKCEVVVYTNIYFTPDLIKIKENMLTNLEWREEKEKIKGKHISKRKIVTLPPVVTHRLSND